MIKNKKIIAENIDLETFAREVGALMEWEGRNDRADADRRQAQQKE